MSDTNTDNENLKNFLNFSTNLKKTALGLTFGKKLFTNPTGLGAEEITKTLKALGLNIPKEVNVSVDVAQILTSGSTAYKAYEAGKDFKDIVKPSSVGLGTLTRLGKEMHWFDSDVASELNVGNSALMLIASGGASVTAWISLAVELGSTSMKAEIEANQLAVKGMIDWYKGRVSQESKNFVSAIGMLQKGEVGIFGFLSQIVTNGSLIFENAVLKNPQFDKVREIIPGLQFLPMGTTTITGWGESTTWYGDTKKATSSLTLNTLVTGKEKLSPEEAMNFLFIHSIYPYLYGYFQAEIDFSKQGKASIFNVMKLIALTKNLTFNTDIVSQLKTQMLTPFELGEERTILSTANVVKRVGIISSEGQIIGKANDITKEQAIRADQIGRIDILLKDPDASSQIRQRFDYPILDFEKTVKADLASKGYSVYTDWRDANNFLAVMDFLDLVINDPLYQKIKPQQIKQFEFMFPKLDDWKIEMQRVNATSMARKINTLAKANVAYFLGTTPDKLVRKTPNAEGVVAKYDVK